MTNWKEYKLGELNCNFLSGFAFKSSDYITNGIPLIKIGNIQNRIVSTKNSVNYVSKDLINSKTDKFLLKNRDVLIAMTGQGSVGRVGRLSLDKGETAFLNQRVGKFLCDEVNLNIDYLYYIISTPEFQKILFDSAAGSGQPNLSPEIILNTKIPYLDYTTQTAIAEILSSLDDKIELNNKINQALENLAQTLFKQWFIDFEFPVNCLNHDSLDLHDEQDFVRKNQGNQDNPINHGSDTYRSSGGALVESELGEIPKGWEVGTLNEILEVKGGTTPSTKEPLFWNGEFHWTSPRDLSNLQFPLLLNTDKKITKEGLKKISSGLLPKGTLLLSSRAPIGYLAITEIETAINQGYIAINAKKGFSNLYLLYWIKSNMDLIIERANGSTFLEISKTNFKQINCLIPHKNILNEYVLQIELLFEQLRTNLLENQELTNLRDTLLPKLISGELEVNSLNRDSLDLPDEQDFKKKADNNQGNQDNPNNQGSDK